MPLFRLFPVLLVSAVLAPLTRAADQPIVYRGAKIHTAAGKPIEKGVLVIQGGTIVAVGPAGKVEIPKGAEVRDLSGKVIAMWMPVMMFFYMGFEHSVVNMFLFPSGLMLGGNFSIADYLRYRAEVARLAADLGWPVQEADLTIWEYDRRRDLRPA